MKIKMSDLTRPDSFFVERRPESSIRQFTIKDIQGIPKKLSLANDQVCLHVKVIMWLASLVDGSVTHSKIIKQHSTVR